MITRTTTTTVKNFTDSFGTKFVVSAIYNPNEEDDAWVAYYNDTTKQEYTCRLEAFLSRFSETVD